MPHARINAVAAKRLQSLLRNITATGAGKTAAEASTAADADFQKKLDKAEDTVKREEQAQQTAYDNDTDHGRNEEQQKKWEQKIAQWDTRGTWGQ